MIRRAMNIQDCINEGITGGTLNTAKHAFQQGTPVYIGEPTGDDEKDIRDLLKMLNVKGEE